MEIEDWLVDHINKNPNISYGSLYRDACLTSKIKFNSHNGSLNKAINRLFTSGVITIEKKDYNTFYRITNQLERDQKLNDLGI